MSNSVTSSRPGQRNWSALSIWMHWLIVLLILVQFVDHDWMEAMWRNFRRDTPITSADITGGWLHIIAGTVILVAAAVRLWDRYSVGRPPYPAGEPTWSLWLAKVTHWLIYAILLAMPILGLVAWFGGMGWAGELHGLMWTPLLVLIGLHVLGAFVQQFWFKTDVLKRIVGAA